MDLRVLYFPERYDGTGIDGRVGVRAVVMDVSDGRRRWR